MLTAKTDYKSVVAELAEQKGLPPVVNHIFLDDHHSISHITGQMKLAEKKAGDSGHLCHDRSRRNAGTYDCRCDPRLHISLVRQD